MGKRIKKLTPKLISFIEKQRLFFVATAMKEGRINLSPKGLDSFRILSES
ncbi:MAG: pyridoxamine 5'-phosphate oxidase family protein [Flavobacteriaceae bacterium]|nr:pyridoxamine 5'-phosphate oxidase family protein [Flavobacteriaceae bacterium]